MTLNDLTNMAWAHRTKILGFTQITIGQMTTWHFLPPLTSSILTTINGLLTVWVGFFNNSQPKSTPNV